MGQMHSKVNQSFCHKKAKWPMKMFKGLQETNVILDWFLFERYERETVVGHLKQISNTSQHTQSLYPQHKLSTCTDNRRFPLSGV